jgi:Protein of unknown function (DUF2842)
MKDENTPVDRPTLRKPAGVFVILSMIALLGYLIGTFSSEISSLPVLAQALVYLIAGIVWIAPLGPLLRWMETGQWSAR